MGKRFPIKKTVACLLIALLLAAPVAYAQQVPPGQKPVMENVFFNVVWGSLFGIVLGSASAVIESDRKTAPTDIRRKVFSGATVGGLIGLGVGLWLVGAGVTFEEQGTLIFSGQDPQDYARPIASSPLPFTLETATEGGFRITGIRATVLDIRF